MYQLSSSDPCNHDDTKHTCIYTGITTRAAFEMTNYTVSESTGKIEIKVTVVSISLNFAPITVLISSDNGSAKGTSNDYKTSLIY